MARPNNPGTIYLDSNVLIGVIQNGQTNSPGAEVLRLAQSRSIEVYISTLSYVEVLGKTRTAPYDPVMEQRVLDALDHPLIVRVEFDRAVALMARRCCHDLRLRPMDAIHLASAVQAGVDAFMTEDDDYPLGTDFQGVWIDRPFVPGGDLLPGM